MNNSDARTPYERACQIRLSIAETENRIIRQKVYLLTGCEYFGDCDQRDKFCGNCKLQTKPLYDRCHAFTYGAFEYWLREDDNDNKNPYRS